MPADNKHIGSSGGVASNNL